MSIIPASTSGRILIVGEIARAVPFNVKFVLETNVVCYFTIDIGLLCIFLYNTNEDHRLKGYIIFNTKSDQTDLNQINCKEVGT